MRIEGEPGGDRPCAHAVGQVVRCDSGARRGRSCPPPRLERAVAAVTRSGGTGLCVVLAEDRDAGTLQVGSISAADGADKWVFGEDAVPLDVSLTVAMEVARGGLSRQGADSEGESGALRSGSGGKSHDGGGIVRRGRGRLDAPSSSPERVTGRARTAGRPNHLRCRGSCVFGHLSLAGRAPLHGLPPLPRPPPPLVAALPRVGPLFDAAVNRG